MALNNLQDVYHDQLQDLHSACAQAIEATTALGQAASDKTLSEALIAGANGIAAGMDEIKSICAEHDIDPKGEHCKGMAGLVKEAHAHGIDAEFGDADARDAMIITQYQRMVHYALSGYGCLVAFANRLDLDGDGARLQQLLDDTYDGDRRMTDLAKGGINKRAA